jgi:NAD(P)-dependent dehydrogenase (short-subunit alcohol dehydrogenase family)
MQVVGATALVTGGQRGLGRSLTEHLLKAGAARVYATARRPSPEPSSDPRLVPLELDVTDPGSIARAAEVADDVDILINNAGITMPRALAVADLSDVRDLLETNLIGPLAVTQQFVPAMRRQGSGHIVNIASVLSWAAGAGVYGASKAALWSLTNSLRLELAADNIHVLGVYLGYTDTDMTASIDAPKNDPLDVARQIVEAINGGEPELLADLESHAARAALSGPVAGQSWEEISRALDPKTTRSTEA